MNLFESPENRTALMEMRAVVEKFSELRAN